MSFEPHYINTYIILLIMITAIFMIIYRTIEYFMDCINNDDSIMNDPYVKLPKRRKRKITF